jgi:hypothetical protein
MKMTTSSNDQNNSTQKAYAARLSTISSVFFPGLGQFLNGETLKAVAHFGGYSAMWLGFDLMTRFYPNKDSTSQFVIVMLMLGGFLSFSFYSARDAYYCVPSDSSPKTP